MWWYVMNLIIIIIIPLLLLALLFISTGEHYGYIISRSVIGVVVEIWAINNIVKYKRHIRNNG